MANLECSRCNKLVKKGDAKCPHCGIILLGYHCKNCQFKGFEKDFPDGNCSRCGWNAKKRLPRPPEKCKTCGKLVDRGEATCQHCGHTQWGLIVFALVVSLGSLGMAAIGFLSTPDPANPDGGRNVGWCCSTFGLLFFALPIYWISKALRFRKVNPK